MNNTPVRKAVIPAAGLGTRMLPISRAVPKEMLPIVDRPAISYLVEECAQSGITEVLIITGRNKNAMEDYFDYNPEYEAAFVRKGKPAMIEEMRDSANFGGVRVFFLRQKETKGLGHAIGCARSFVGNEPFAVLYGDDIVFSETKPATAQLIDTYHRYGKAVCGVKTVPHEMIKKYCSLKAEPIEGTANEYNVDDMIEKPQTDAEAFSDMSIIGRVVLPPEIFDIIDNTAPGAGNEIQLTDAIATLARRDGVTAVEYEGERFDLGSKLGLMMANVKRAAVSDEIGEDFKAFLKEYAKNL